MENLRASGQIAGETSAAYAETMTITLTSCRSVGIGAYLVRLGQRTIQTERSHIILTGFNALNKLMGQEVKRGVLPWVGVVLDMRCIGVVLDGSCVGPAHSGLTDFRS